LIFGNGTCRIMAEDRRQESRLIVKGIFLFISFIAFDFLHFQLNAFRILFLMQIYLATDIDFPRTLSKPQSFPKWHLLSSNPYSRVCCLLATLMLDFSSVFFSSCPLSQLYWYLSNILNLKNTL